ncbi:MAG TPA: flagellar basal body rod protein FlgB [Rhodocyclaceae bacterium]|nr:flagellar basal body rod protein FlgB [Rhodocyclaceae bacterium]HMV52137.1 flagellar basal body rod protein FlgB [Rhodocyclaceae bacterium]HMZ82963.1 flagellar basal body rod protein FlgB [Rhodocyclaceae bacterium]HNA03069.1 flagellar basal body rod protein FlgB [Rhodocyclaceae bacterium]HNB76935.1 flagellar basal body rod protein FlgB [Rhodocyclaceae bacterium]
MSNSIDQALKFQQTALNLRAQRSQLLASNIANADTPHFKARDIDFKNALGQAMAGRGSDALPMAASSSRHIASPAPAAYSSAQYRTEMQSSVDGNTVNLDVERAQFAENAVQYEASVTFINGTLKTMQTAITGQ